MCKCFSAMWILQVVPSDSGNFNNKAIEKPLPLYERSSLHHECSRKFVCGRVLLSQYIHPSTALHTLPRNTDESQHNTIVLIFDCL